MQKKKFLNKDFLLLQEFFCVIIAKEFFSVLEIFENYFSHHGMILTPQQPFEEPIICKNNNLEASNTPEAFAVGGRQLQN